ncbi:hypothetical protein UP10_35760 [Bradyrhizobium sp. LTSPM299]|nr:hypothetical protein UP10_35760 [Bradyrhizobium sp. LTSPM299]
MRFAHPLVVAKVLHKLALALLYWTHVDKLDTYAIAFDPSYPAVANNPVAFRHQSKAVWQISRIWDVDGGPVS